MAPDKGKNKAVDFETMLRRHLSRGGAPVSPCAGFDIDTASSYLEGALWSPSRTRYEAHLAGCPSCRQYLIGLARFSQLAVVSEVTASPVLRESKYWAFWNSSIIRRFKNLQGDSSWRWNLTVAGSTIAACAVLIAVLASHLWRQEMMGSSNNAMGERAVPATAPTPSSEAFSNFVGAERGGDATHHRESQPKEVSKVPVLPDRDAQLRMIAPLPGDPNKIEPANKIDANTQRFAGIGGTIGGIVQPPVNFSQQGFTNNSGPNNSQSRQQYQSFSSDNSAVTSAKGVGIGDLRKSALANADEVAAEAKVEAQAQARKDASGNARAAQETADKATSFDSGIGLRITPPPEDNPIQAKKASGRTRDNKTLASGASTAKQGWISRVMQKGLAPNRRPDAEEKPAGNKENDESEKFLIRYVRDKTFSYQRGFWVDHDYNPGVTMWKVTHITRGSKQFEDLLSKEPHLKEFFSLGKVILVWRDEIYRVSDKSDK